MNRGAANNQNAINAVMIRGIGKIQIAIMEGLMNVYTRLGRPKADYKDPHFWLVVDNMIQVWSKLFPYELDEFLKTVERQRETEDKKKSKKAGLKQSFAIPANLFRIFKTFWPDIKITNKTFNSTLLSRYPLLFKTTND